MTARRLLVLLLMGMAACATPRSRIARRQAAFDAYPPAVQASIRAGRADVGFSREQVELALGRPDRKYSRTTATVAQDVWAYGGSSSRPRLSLGLGMGFGGGFSSGGMGLESGPALEDRARIVFEHDAVVSVEELHR